MLFENGVRGVYIGQKDIVVGTMGFELMGSEGSISYREDTGLAYARVRDPASGRPAEGPLSIGYFGNSGIRAGYEEMFDIIENGGESVSPGTEARKALQVLLGFLQSNHAGGTWIYVPG